MPPKKVSLPPNPPPDPSQNIPFQYTTFFSVAPLNAKNVSSSYLKTENQTWISRSQAAIASQQPQSLNKKRKRDLQDALRDAEDGAADASLMLDQDDDLEIDDEEVEAAENTPAHRAIVIHPGSENIRIGRATDLFPITVPNAIARRAKLSSTIQTPPPPPSRPADSNGTTDAHKLDATEDVQMSEADGPQNQDPFGAAERTDGADDEAENDESVRASRKNPRRSAAAADRSASGPSSGTPAPVSSSNKVKTPLDEGIEVIRNDLRAIMRQEKLRSVGNAKNLAANYNDGVQPEDVPEHNDMFGLEWIDEDVGGENDVLFGEQALRLASFSQPKTKEPNVQQRRQQQSSGTKPLSPPDPERPWKLFRPFKRGTLDLNAYQEHYGPSAAVQALLGDIRSIFEHAITSPLEDADQRQETGKVVAHGLGIPKEDLHNYTVILIIPDLFARSDVKALTDVLLLDIGFAQMCIQQESVCATFGAGLSSGCVVDLGAEYTSISCVEEGLVLPETRIHLSYGGRDLTNFLAELFIRAKFPYRELNYKSNIADAMLIDELKRKLITLNPADIGLNIHDFYLRLPSRPTNKYLFRTYDELIMGPMSLFDTSVFDLDSKKLLKGKFRAGHIEEDGEDDAVVEDAPELSIYYGLDVPITGAMTSCVKHLLPPPAPAPAPSAANVSGNAAAVATAPGTATGTGAPGSEAGTPAPQSEAKGKLGIDANGPTGSALPSRAGSPTLGGPTASHLGAGDSLDASARPSPAPQNGLGGAATGPGSGAGAGGMAGDASSSAQPAEPARPTIDIHFEASKTALDVAVFNSLLTSIGQVGPAGDERLRKMSNNILCVGGTALIPGLGAALEARLTSLLGNHFLSTTGDASNAPKVTVIPPPREMDPQVLAWKGMSVFARLEAPNQELCLRKEDWLLFGYRALKEKTLFL